MRLPLLHSYVKLAVIIRLGWPHLLSISNDMSAKYTDTRVYMQCAHGDWSSSFHLTLILLLAICDHPSDWIVHEIAEIYYHMPNSKKKSVRNVFAVHCFCFCVCSPWTRRTKPIKRTHTRLSLSMYSNYCVEICASIDSLGFLFRGFWNVKHSPRNLCDLLRMSCCRCWFVLILLAVCGLFFSREKGQFKEWDRDNPIGLQIKRNERQHNTNNEKTDAQESGEALKGTHNEYMICTNIWSQPHSTTEKRTNKKRAS